MRGFTREKAATMIERLIFVLAKVKSSTMENLESEGPERAARLFNIVCPGFEAMQTAALRMAELSPDRFTPGDVMNLLVMVEREPAVEILYAFYYKEALPCPIEAMASLKGAELAPA